MLDGDNNIFKVASELYFNTTDKAKKIKATPKTEQPDKIAKEYDITVDRGKSVKHMIESV